MGKLLQRSHARYRDIEAERASVPLSVQDLIRELQRKRVGRSYIGVAG